MDMEKPNHNQPSSLRVRLIYAAILLLGFSSGIIYLFNFKFSGLVPDFPHKTAIHVYLFLFMFLSILYWVSVFLILKNNSTIGRSKGLLGVIIFFAVAFRLCLIPMDPVVLSKDVYRFIWDGRVQQNGLNPYSYPPADEALKTLRDERIYPNLNRKEYPTIYPAGAQFFFRMAYALVGDSVHGFKGLMVFFDILTLLVLTALLRTYGFEANRLILYAWNPLVIFEIAYSGHLEGITVFLMVAALLLYALHRKMPAVVILALSSAIKLYPALLLAAILNRGERVKGILLFSFTFVLLYLPFMAAGSKLSGFLPIYLKNPYESFNMGLKFLIMGLFPGLNYYLLSQLFILALAAAGLLIFFKVKQNDQVMRCAFILSALLMVLMPASLHPWYVILVIPYLAFYPSPAWLIFSCTVSLSYLKYVSAQGIMPTWVLLAEYLPLFALLAAGPILRKAMVRRGGRAATSPSIVSPAAGSEDR
jgi:alpha-1,6-mannosyltransferase